MAYSVVHLVDYLVGFKSVLILLVLWKILPRLFYCFSCSLIFLKLNHLKSRTECGFSDIFLRHICSTVTETIGVTSYAASFGAKMFRKPHLKLLRRFSVHRTNNIRFNLKRYLLNISNKTYRSIVSEEIQKICELK